MHLTVRQKNISHLCSAHVSKVLADLIAVYDYYVEGKSRVFDTNISISSIGMLPDGRIVYRRENGQVKICDPNTGICNSVLEFNNLIGFVTITQKGKILSGTPTGHIRIWDPATNICEDVWANNCFNEFVHFITEISDKRVACGCEPHKIKIINTHTGAVEYDLYHRMFSECKLLPDGRIVSVSAYVLKIWNIKLGTCDIKVHSDDVQCNIIIIPYTDTKFNIVCGLYNGRIKILSFEKDSCNYVHSVTLKGHSKGIDLLMSLSNGLLVSASDNLIKIWNMNDGTELMTLCHSNYVTCIAELPDGRIVSGSDNCTLKIWNLDHIAIERCDTTLYDGASISCIAVLPDGRIVSGSRNNDPFLLTIASLRIWN